MTRRRLARWSTTVVAVLALVVAAGWAGWTIGRGDGGTDPSNLIIGSVTVSPRMGTISEEYGLPLVLEWTAEAVYPYLGTDGVLTGIGAAPGEYVTIASGDTLAMVDATPIVAVAGQMPAYRELAAGTVGEDVRQFEYQLVDDGLLAAAGADGRFDDATAEATAAWWARRGVPERSAVPLGSVVFVPEMPRWMAVDPAQTVGGVVAFGTAFASVATAEPVGRTELTQAQVGRLGVPGATIELAGSDGEPGARFDVDVSMVAVDDRGVPTLTLRPDGQRISASLGGRPGETTRVRATLVITPPTDGLIVPLAALDLSGDSEHGVVRVASGETVNVVVRAIAGGDAVVEGLAADAVIRIPPHG